METGIDTILKEKDLCNTELDSSTRPLSAPFLFRTLEKGDSHILAGSTTQVPLGSVDLSKNYFASRIFGLKKHLSSKRLTLTLYMSYIFLKLYDQGRRY